MSAAAHSQGAASSNSPSDYDVQSLASQSVSSLPSHERDPSLPRLSSEERLSSSPSIVSYTLPDLPPPSQSSLTDPAVPFRARPSHHHHTWARTFHSYPELYITPHSISEVQRAVILARRCRRRLMVVGGGTHSPSDITCTSAWMLNLDNLSSVISVSRHSNEKSAVALVQAGISLHNLNIALARDGFTIPNLGSIDPQSLAGAIATGTHGSSLSHGLLSQNVRGLRVVLADGSAVWCSPTRRSDLFKAALVSLGAIGVITEIEYAVVTDSNICFDQSVLDLPSALSQWHKNFWTDCEFTRCWWMPYTNRMILWKAYRTQMDEEKVHSNSWYGGMVGYHTYRMLLWLAYYIPPILPTVEWFVSGMQYRFSPGFVSSGIAPQRTGLLMDCLFSQFVNEWAVPFEKGPEIITRLSKWINGDEKGAEIPFSSRGLYVHCPIEVRVTQGSEEHNPTRGYLDPTFADGPTLYINATLYRPFGLDPPCRKRYYMAFEWLMKEYGGRPHWAKNFAHMTQPELHAAYGDNMQSWLRVRREVDPDGLFVGAWHRRYLLGPAADAEDVEGAALALEELELERRPARDGGVVWSGKQRSEPLGRPIVPELRQSSTMRSSRSDESFYFVEETKVSSS